MNEKLLTGCLRITGKMHTNDAERHTERYDTKGIDGHPIKRIGRIAVEHTGEGDRAKDDKSRNAAHKRNALKHCCTHDICQ